MVRIFCAVSYCNPRRCLPHEICLIRHIANASVPIVGVIFVGENQIFVLSKIRRLVHIVPRAKSAVVADGGGDVAPSDGVVVAGFEVGVIVVAIKNRKIQAVFGRDFEVYLAVNVVECEFAVDVELTHHPSEDGFADVGGGCDAVLADWDFGAGGEREGRYFAADAKFAKAAVFGADVGD